MANRLLRLDDDLDQRLAAASAAMSTSVSAFSRAALEAAVQRVDERNLSLTALLGMRQREDEPA